MKRLLLLPALLIALSIGGCETLYKFLDPTGVSILVGGKSIIADTHNPIGVEQMQVIEAAYRVAVQTGYDYRVACYAKPIAELPSICNNRRQVIRIFQAAYVRAKPIMAQLRQFVKANDQVSAKSVLIAAGQAIADMEAAVTKYGAGT